MVFGSTESGTEVDSACVTLVRRPEPLLTDNQAPVFTKIVKRAFSQRRKMMFKLLKEDWAESTLQVAFAAAQLSAQVRAEATSLRQFIILTGTLCP